MARIVIDIPALHSGQQSIWDMRTRLNAIRCGRRWGKTAMIVKIAADQGGSGRKIGIFTPEHKQWIEPYDAIVEYLDPIVLRSNKSDGYIKLLGGGKIDFWSLNDNELAGRGREYDEVLIDEGAFTKKNMLDIWKRSIKPTMLTRKGRAWVFSTPNGDNPDNFFWKVCNDPDLGFSQYHAPSGASPFVPPDELEKERLSNDPDVFRQEFLAEFVDWRGRAFFALDSFLVDGEAIPMPTRCDYVYAVVDTAVKTGKKNDGTAVSFYALLPEGVAKHRLVVLDWDIIQIEGALLETWLPTIFQRLEALALQTGARMGSAGAWIEDKATGMVLLQQAKNLGWNAHAIDSKLTSVGKDERSISVSGYVYQGMVKICTFAYDKVSTYKDQTRNHWIGQVCGYRIGIEDQEDDLEDTMTYGVALGLGDYRGF